MSPRPLTDLVHPSWAGVLSGQAATLARLGEFLREEIASGRGYLPAGEHVLRAFAQPLDAVRVLIVGQDPYPTPGRATGLAFSFPPGAAPQHSLKNILTELQDDLGITKRDGDLTGWAEQGVLLLNAVLTVPLGQANGHKRWGWEALVGQVLAGSALGNKAIAKQVARIGGGTWPVAFLGDEAMMTFWQDLRARIEAPAVPAEAEGATRAAEAVFAHFLAVAERGHLAHEVPA